jgi:hypothetical protein
MGDKQVPLIFFFVVLYYYIKKKKKLPLKSTMSKKRKFLYIECKMIVSSSTLYFLYLIIHSFTEILGFDVSAPSL